MSKVIILSILTVTFSGCAQRIVWSAPDTTPSNYRYKDTLAYRWEQSINAQMDPKTKAKWDAMAKAKTEEVDVIVIEVLPKK